MQDLNLHLLHRFLHYFHYFRHPNSIDYYYLVTMLVIPKTLIVVITTPITLTITLITATTTITTPTTTGLTVTTLMKQLEVVAIALIKILAKIDFELKLKESIGELIHHPQTLIRIKSLQLILRFYHKQSMLQLLYALETQVMLV